MAAHRRERMDEKPEQDRSSEVEIMVAAAWRLPLLTILGRAHTFNFFESL